MKRFAARFFGEDGSPSNQLRSDAGMLVDGTHLGIKQEGMIAAVPRNVDEPDQQSVLVPGTNPAQAVRADPVPPTERRAPAVRLCEREQLLVLYVASELVLQTHVSMVADEESLGHQPSDM